MSFLKEEGYIPVPLSDLVNALRLRINTEFGTNYTESSFVGTNWYKYFYTLLQRVLENETKTAEIFLKLSEYIQTTNLKIQRPSVSLPGLIDSFAANEWVASIKANELADAGTISICVDVDDEAPDYAAKRLEICTFIKNFIAAGIVSLGTEEELITLTNGQQFSFKFFLPNRIPVLLRLTLTASDNQIVVLPSDEEIRITLFNNINSRYRLGWDFEPQRYFTQQIDAPWAATILLEYTQDGGDNWFSSVYEADFDDLFTFDLEDIAVVLS